MKGRDIVSNEFIVPTGRIIKEYLDEYNISQKELSARIGVSEKHISNVLNGNSRLTEEFALKLEKVLIGTPASYWLNYETKYRESLARDLEKYKINANDLDKIASRFNFKEVFKGLELTLIDQAIEMLKILKISDFTNYDAAYSNLSIDFMEDGGSKESIAVWLGLCETEIEIQNADIEEYNSKLLEKSLMKFKTIACNENLELSIRSCRKLCNKLGIYLVQCEAIKNSKVRGALTTYKGNPAIYLSGRFKTHDNIWFAFMHEIAHLLMHYNKNEVIISFEELYEVKSLKEEEANGFARDFFISTKDYEAFIGENNFTAESIKEFAHKEKVLPGIVLARLQHDKFVGYDQYSYLKK